MSNSEQFVHPSSDLDDFPMDYNSVPTAIPVYGIIPSIAAAPSATAEVIPTHEIALSTPASREWVDKIHIMTAESHARVKAEQEWQKDHAGALEGDSKVREVNDVINIANQCASVRNEEGIEIKQDKWLKAVLSLKKESSSVSSLERPKQKAPGYQIKEYQTKDYSGLEYQSNYEYKSVYD
jgi:hypothetical protein